MKKEKLHLEKFMEYVKEHLSEDRKTMKVVREVALECMEIEDDDRCERLSLVGKCFVKNPKLQSIGESLLG